MGRTRKGKRRITDIGVQRPGERDRACGQIYRDRGMADTTSTDVSVPANSGKRPVGSVPGNDKPPKRVRFARQVGIRGVDGLKQQLERWSKECVVCYFVGGDEAGRSQTYTVWECRQEVAEEVRARSREMAARMRTVAAQGGCAGRGVPQTICRRWQQGARWEESVGQCQYEGVLISTMIVMVTLGRADGRERVGGWLRQDGVGPWGAGEEVSRWFDTKIWSEREVSG